MTFWGLMAQYQNKMKDKNVLNQKIATKMMKKKMMMIQIKKKSFHVLKQVTKQIIKK